MYQYSQFWFFDCSLLDLFDTTKEYHIFVVGCSDGLSSVFFSDNLLNHPNSTLTCVDPHNDYFDYNISICKNRDKITVVPDFSIDKTFNFIYVDTALEIDTATLDIDGILWIEDYSIHIDNFEVIHESYPCILKKLNPKPVCSEKSTNNIS